MKDNLDKEEREILESYERGEWQKVANHKEEVERHIKIAENTLKKDKRINIRLTSRDLLELKLKAVEEGIPYQTLVSSILHKYVNGRLVEKAG